ncbi:hypothetical protein T4C_5312 [Trichinella pseudospiralis]|uniref:Uncharacterized protein n=1 Tax=Trichinella pseudospiralis TaxID=6337 RepID=A0A0V1K0Q8_TRIPS|nr:hypothetical protein T4C_5312 [Trichinella pseudospiralis]KRZ40816.1 hypothetical protein T4C_5312 [Trichinella pseudospiralis]
MHCYSPSITFYNMAVSSVTRMDIVLRCFYAFKGLSTKAFML